MGPADAIPTAAEFPLSTEVEVRFVDVDAMGHVNNANYATFFEEARVAYFREAYPEEFSDRQLETTFPFILLDLYCRYLSPVRMGERLRVSIRLARMGGKSFDFEYLITSRTDGRAVATGRTTQVYFNYAEDRTEPVPDPLRKAFARIEGGVDGATSPSSGESRSGGTDGDEALDAGRRIDRRPEVCMVRTGDDGGWAWKRIGNG